MSIYDDFVDAAARNVSSSGFRVSRDITLADSTTVNLAASRTTFSWKRLVIVSQHLFLRHVTTATTGDFHALIDCGFIYANQVNGVPLIRGLRFCHLVVPCIAVDSATPSLIRFVSSRPRKHWALFELPVLRELSTGKTYYFEESEMWGSHLASELRSIIHPNVIA